MCASSKIGEFEKATACGASIFSVSARIVAVRATTGAATVCFVGVVVVAVGGLRRCQCACVERGVRKGELEGEEGIMLLVHGLLSFAFGVVLFVFWSRKPESILFP